MFERHLTLMRIGPDFDGNEKGIIKVMQGDHFVAAFNSRENDVNLKWSSLRMGVYEFKHSMKEYNLDGSLSANPIRCLRPMDEGIRSVLFHRAYNDNPENLSGCVAPGKFEGLDAFSESEEAMARIFELLGGYEPDKIVKVVVLSNASGVGGNETRDNWRRIK